MNGGHGQAIGELPGCQKWAPHVYDGQGTFVREANEKDEEAMSKRVRYAVNSSLVSAMLLKGRTR